MNQRQHEIERAQAQLREKDDAVIEQKKRAVEQARAERVDALLDEEQRKYGLKRRGIPLSRMPV